MQLSKQMATVIKNTGDHFFEVGSVVEYLYRSGSFYRFQGVSMTHGKQIAQSLEPDDFAYMMPYNSD